MFKYVSFRSGLALILSLFISTAIGRRIIDKLQMLQIGETVRNLGLEGQMSKKGTPTMGGIIIIIAILIPTLLCAKLNNIYVILMLVTTVWLGALGFADDYIKVFKMWEVHEEVISNLNLPYSYTQMRNMLSVVNESDTRMLDISFTSPSAQEAAAVANEYAKVASQYIADTMSTDKPNIMSVALVPSNPVSPNRTKNIMLGFIGGFVLACGIVTIQMLMDDKYKTAEDIRKYTGLVTLAVIPVEDANAEKKRAKSAGRKA